MALINLSSNNGLKLEQAIGRSQSNEILMGESDIYKRIISDCEADSRIWYMWYDLALPIPAEGKSSIQIDFLLLCEEGAIVIEVKGGIIDVIGGQYSYLYKGTYRPMRITPFKQAYDYKWALYNNNIFVNDKVFIDYACAFPHSSLNRTSQNDNLDLRYRLWNKEDQNSDESFAEFCIRVLREGKKLSGKGSFIKKLSEVELQDIVKVLNPDIRDDNKYSLSSMYEVLEWLQIDNLSILESLRKNQRIVIEGGPGTGKTTIAKGYIKRYHNMKGIYLCWTGLLASKIRYELQKERLTECKVDTYNSFIKKLSNQNIDLETIRYQDDFRTRYSDFLSQVSFDDYEYVIIDEAQDIADLGLDLFLNEIVGKRSNGLKSGRFLVLYDIEQGYNSSRRKLDEFIAILINNSAHFILDENKRVPSNKLIVEYANKVLLIDYEQDSYSRYIEALFNNDIPGLRIYACNSYKLVKRTIKDRVKQLRELYGETSTTTILVHSDLKTIVDGNPQSLYQSLDAMDLLEELSERNIDRPSIESVAYTSVLKYKGLEDNNIILILPQKKLKSSWENFLFEMYVGMTRAIMNLDIIILNV